MTSTTLEPSATRLDRDAACGSCGYNLRGLRLSDTCPECGSSVEKSLREELPYETQRELHWTISGLRLTALGLGVLVMMPAACSIGQYHIPRRTSPWSWSAPLFHLSEMWFPLLLSVTTICMGVWMLMYAAPGRRRMSLLVGWAAFLGLACVPMLPVVFSRYGLRTSLGFGVGSIAGTPIQRLPTRIAFWATLAGVGGLVCLLFMLQPLANRLGARGLKRSLTAATVAVVLLVVVEVGLAALRPTINSYRIRRQPMVSIWPSPPTSFAEMMFQLIERCTGLAWAVIASATAVLLLILWRRLVHYASRQAV